MQENRRRAIGVLIVIGLPVAVLVVAFLVVKAIIDVDGAEVSHTVSAARTAWLIIAVGTTALVVLAGWAVNKQVFGALIDTRNRYSLSRLQLAGWTVLVLSAWLAIVMVRISAHLPINEALRVGIPGPVVAALGLSVGSFALAAGIKDAKRHRTVDLSVGQKLRGERNDLSDKIQEATGAWAAEKAAADQESDETKKASLEISVRRKKRAVEALTAQLESIDEQLAAQAKAEGLLAKNDSPDQASAGDFFKGDEVVDAKTVDFGKVQMLYITIAILAVYGFMLADALTTESLFTAGAGGVSLPDLDESLVALVGISHGGYLAVKASNSSPAA